MEIELDEDEIEIEIEGEEEEEEDAKGEKILYDAMPLEYSKSNQRYFIGGHGLRCALGGFLTIDIIHSLILATESNIHFVPNRFFATPYFMQREQAKSLSDRSGIEFSMLTVRSITKEPLSFVVPIIRDTPLGRRITLAVILYHDKDKRAFIYLYTPIVEEDRKIIRKNNKILIDNLRESMAGLIPIDCMWTNVAANEIIGPVYLDRTREGVPQDDKSDKKKKKRKAVEIEVDAKEAPLPITEKESDLRLVIGVLHVLTAIRFLRRDGGSFHYRTGQTCDDDEAVTETKEKIYSTDDKSRFYIGTKKNTLTIVPNRLREAFLEEHVSDLPHLLDLALNNLPLEDTSIEMRLDYLAREYATFMNSIAGNEVAMKNYLLALKIILLAYGYSVKDLSGLTYTNFYRKGRVSENDARTFFAAKLRIQVPAITEKEAAGFLSARDIRRDQLLSDCTELMSGIIVSYEYSFFPKLAICNEGEYRPLIRYLYDEQSRADPEFTRQYTIVVQEIDNSLSSLPADKYLKLIDNLFHDNSEGAESIRVPPNLNCAKKVKNAIYQKQAELKLHEAERMARTIILPLRIGSRSDPVALDVCDVGYTEKNLFENPDDYGWTAPFTGFMTILINTVFDVKKFPELGDVFTAFANNPFFLNLVKNILRFKAQDAWSWFKEDIGPTIALMRRELLEKKYATSLKSGETEASRRASAFRAEKSGRVYYIPPARAVFNEMRYRLGSIILSILAKGLEEDDDDDDDDDSSTETSEDEEAALFNGKGRGARLGDEASNAMIEDKPQDRPTNTTTTTTTTTTQQKK